MVQPPSPAGPAAARADERPEIKTVGGRRYYHHQDNNSIDASLAMDVYSSQPNKDVPYMAQGGNLKASIGKVGIGLMHMVGKIVDLFKKTVNDPNKKNLQQKLADFNQLHDVYGYNQSIAPGSIFEGTTYLLHDIVDSYTLGKLSQKAHEHHGNYDQLFEDPYLTDLQLNETEKRVIRSNRTVIQRHLEQDPFLFINALDSKTLTEFVQDVQKGNWDTIAASYPLLEQRKLQVLTASNHEYEYIHVANLLILIPEGDAKNAIAYRLINPYTRRPVTEKAQYAAEALCKLWKLGGVEVSKKLDSTINILLDDKFPAFIQMLEQYERKEELNRILKAIKDLRADQRLSPDQKIKLYQQHLRDLETNIDTLGITEVLEDVYSLNACLNASTRVNPLSAFTWMSLNPNNGSVSFFEKPTPKNLLRNPALTVDLPQEVQQAISALYQEGADKLLSKPVATLSSTRN